MLNKFLPINLLFFDNADEFSSVPGVSHEGEMSIQTVGLAGLLGKLEAKCDGGLSSSCSFGLGGSIVGNGSCGIFGNGSLALVSKNESFSIININSNSIFNSLGSLNAKSEFGMSDVGLFNNLGNVSVNCDIGILGVGLASFSSKLIANSELGREIVGIFVATAGTVSNQPGEVSIIGRGTFGADAKVTLNSLMDFLSVGTFNNLSNVSSIASLPLSTLGEFSPNGRNVLGGNLQLISQGSIVGGASIGLNGICSINSSNIINFNSSLIANSVLQSLLSECNFSTDIKAQCNCNIGFSAQGTFTSTTKLLANSIFVVSSQGLIYFDTDLITTFNTELSDHIYIVLNVNKNQQYTLEVNKSESYLFYLDRARNYNLER